MVPFWTKETRKETAGGSASGSARSTSSRRKSIWSQNWRRLFFHAAASCWYSSPSGSVVAIRKSGRRYRYAVYRARTSAAGSGSVQTPLSCCGRQQSAYDWSEPQPQGAEGLGRRSYLSDRCTPKPLPAAAVLRSVRFPLRLMTSRRWPETSAERRFASPTCRFCRSSGVRLSRYSARRRATSASLSASPVLPRGGACGAWHRPHHPARLAVCALAVCAGGLSDAGTRPLAAGRASSRTAAELRDIIRGSRDR
mmetsp:Transcript_27204/g.79641  ORF Transcript_27204/g.79641 Transcript_27204/m.79641 type:complete len:253 (+) Transcript_27204:128-886(+)